MSTNATTPPAAVTVIGLGSNLIVRDGGVAGVVIRLGRGFSDIAIEPGSRVRAGFAGSTSMPRLSTGTTITCSSRCSTRSHPGSWIRPTSRSRRGRFCAVRRTSRF